MYEVAFFTVCDSRMFTGLVALVNSLRLVGHREPVVVVDAGLTPRQAEMIASEANVLPAPGDMAPVLLAPLGPTLRPAEVSILLDVDIIVTRPLARLIDEANGGRVVAFVNDPPNHERFFPEWGPRLDLGPLRRQPYVNAGQLLVPASLREKLLPRWTKGQGRVREEETRYGGARITDPFYFADQDVLNATLAAEIAADDLAIMEHRLAPHPPFSGLRLEDESSLLVRYSDGTAPFLLHHTLQKPWIAATRWNTYAALLPRLLLAEDVPVRLRAQELPPRLRGGSLAAAADRVRADVQARARIGARRQLGRLGVRTRIASRRRAWARRA